VIGGAPEALARRRDWLYLGAFPVPSDDRMAPPMSTPQQMIAAPPPSRKVASVIVAGGAGLGVVLLVGSLGLWFHYGTAVFFEMITSGISACF
jgi:hypothetical protein